MMWICNISGTRVGKIIHIKLLLEYANAWMYEYERMENAIPRVKKIWDDYHCKKKLSAVPVTFASFTTFSKLYSLINMQEKWFCFHTVSRLIFCYWFVPQHAYISSPVDADFKIDHSYWELIKFVIENLVWSIYCTVLVLLKLFGETNTNSLLSPESVFVT